MNLRDRLHRVPEPPPVPHIDDDAVATSVRYLTSADALRSIAADTYWPKWSSPWWQMLLLFEIGEAHCIPQRAVAAMVHGLNALPVHRFPIHSRDVPAEIDPSRDISCHCALGCMYRVLVACGVDVDHALPWIAPWFPRYQMSDGGLNCDSAAYLVTGECPSSMVGTVAPFEAMTLGAPASWSSDRAAFVERAARFLSDRELRHGSTSVHNAEERASARVWSEMCFPRFYFYDVLRGLAALVRWATIAARPLQHSAIASVVDGLIAAFPDGIVRLGRRGFAGVGTLDQDSSGAWVRRSQAFTFPLLQAVSEPGRPCPYLTEQWLVTRRALAELDASGLIAW